MAKSSVNHIQHAMINQFRPDAQYVNVT